MRHENDRTRATTRGWEARRRLAAASVLVALASAGCSLLSLDALRAGESVGVTGDDGGGSGSGAGANEGGSGGGDAAVGAGGAICLPKTCANLGVECGPAPDGCGRELDCSSCSANQVCSEGLAANRCFGLDGTWLTLEDACDGVSMMTPGIEASVTISGTEIVLESKRSDGSCTSTWLGTLVFGATGSFTVSMSEGQCSPMDGCWLGDQPTTACTATTLAPPKETQVTYEFLDWQTLQATLGPDGQYCFQSHTMKLARQ